MHGHVRVCVCVYRYMAFCSRCPFVFGGRGVVCQCPEEVTGGTIGRSCRSRGP